VSDFKKELDTDTGGVESHRFLESPISGPGSANRLITITGIAVPDADISDGRKPASELNYGDIFIKTDYRLKDCLLYTSPSPRDLSTSRMPSSA